MALETLVQSIPPPWLGRVQGRHAVTLSTVFRKRVIGVIRRMQRLSVLSTPVIRGAFCAHTAAEPTITKSRRARSHSELRIQSTQ